MEVFISQSTDWILSEEAFMIYKQCMWNPTYENYLVKVKKSFEDVHQKIYICSLNGRYVGIITLRITDSGTEITGIAVSNKYKNMGIGSYMIQQVIEKEKLHSIFAETDDDAVEFYRKNGFDINKKIKQYPDGNRIRYECILTNGLIRGKGCNY